MNKMNKSKPVDIRHLIREILKEQLGDLDIPTSTPSSTVLKVPQLSDIGNDEEQQQQQEPTSFDNEQDPTDDAEQMSIEQIARTIEDTVETEGNTENEEPQQ